MSVLQDSGKFLFGLLMVIGVLFYAFVAPINARDTPSAVDPKISEWDFAWPIEAWNICWMVVYNFIPGIAMMMVGPLAKYKERIDYMLFFYRAWIFHMCWTIGGAVLLYNTKDTVAVAAPSIWNRGFRSWCMMAGVLGFIVVVGIIASVYVLFVMPTPEKMGELEEEMTLNDQKLPQYIETRPVLQKLLGHTQFQAPMPADAKV
ncbi:hypothetical protein OF83DRAFT_1107969 [Amylostereum chailletii]|nr:hypothetical protein OF83DRAFT_1107969 [Amylostereum chailletii]